MNEYNMVLSFEQECRQKALELTRGMPDAYNIEPVIRLVREAYSRGFSLHKMSAAERQQVFCK